MFEKNSEQLRDDDEVALNRRFKYAVYVYTAIEFIAIMVLIYYKSFR